MLQHLNHSTSSFNERQKQQHIKIWVNEINPLPNRREGAVQAGITGCLCRDLVSGGLLLLSADNHHPLWLDATRLTSCQLDPSLNQLFCIAGCQVDSSSALDTHMLLVFRRCRLTKPHTLVLSQFYFVCASVCLWFNYLKYSRETAVRQLHFYLFQTFALSENQPEALIRQTQPVCKCILISYNEHGTLSCWTTIMCWMCLLLSPVSPCRCSSGVADRRKKHTCQLFCPISCWSHFIFYFSTFLNLIIINSMF